MQMESNRPFIKYIVSREHIKNDDLNLNAKRSQDFILPLKIYEKHLEFQSIGANKTANEFISINRHTLNIEAASQHEYIPRNKILVRHIKKGNETHWKTTVHYEKSNGVIVISDIQHTLILDIMKLKELKDALIQNKYEKTYFIIYPTHLFFEEIGCYKPTIVGSGYTTKIEHSIEYYLKGESRKIVIGDYFE